MFQFIVLAAIIAVVRSSGVLPVAAPLAVAPVARSVIAEPYDPNPQYSYGYEVQDPLTGDSHGQVETRNGDVVTGSYALLDSDGTRRQVDYSADPINGFNAVVSKQPVAVAAPAPVVHAAPIAPVLRSAPLAPAPILRSAPLAPAPILRSAPLAAAPIFRSAPLAPAPLFRSAPVLSAPLIRSAPLAPVAPAWAAPALRAAPLW